MVSDSVQTIALEQLAEGGHYLPGAFARNILIADNLLNYQEPVIIGEDYKSIRKYHAPFTSKGLNKTVIAYPNPCKDYLIIKRNKSSKVSLNLSLANSDGKILIQKDISDRNNLIYLSMKELSPGIYFIVIKANGEKTEILKIVKND